MAQDRTRVYVFILMVMVVMLGLGSRYGLSGFWSKYLGVCFWATMVYMVILFCKPDISVIYAAGLALAISWTVEFAQLTSFPSRVSSIHPLLALAFGRVFSIYDLPAYLAGVVIGIIFHLILKPKP